jgi:O-acetyl-ADP-ribose deacetylase (regulator of RNase III)
MTRVFICYKKKIVRGTDDQQHLEKNVHAGVLYDILRQSGEFEPWVDTSVGVGAEWEDEIYRELAKSDVLAVIVAPGVSKSQWVHREIIIARALALKILPICVDLTEEQLTVEITGLEIGDIQYHPTTNLDLSRSTALLAEIAQGLRDAATATRLAQRDRLAGVFERQASGPLKADNVQERVSYRMGKDYPSTKLHICSGDISTIDNIDVIVNSENDMMQMARFFDGDTVSSVLRRRGSYRRGPHHDVIQDELNQLVGTEGRPVGYSTAWPTSAGGPYSALATINHARVILHVAAVQAVEADNGVKPYRQPEQIEQAAYNALDTMCELNQANGVFAPAGTAQRDDQQRRADRGEGRLTSIIFPLFGTGKGGAAVTEVIDPMLRGITSFLANCPDREFVAGLSGIYLSAYTQEIVDTLTQALDQRFTRI